MDLYQKNKNPTDYSAGGRDGHGKATTCPDDRLDSGLDSLKDDELSSLTSETEGLRISCREEPGDGLGEPWQLQRTEDGDTLLHLAIIQEEKEYAFQMINLSRHSAFLNIQNYERQTPLHLAVITEQPEVAECLLKAGCDPQLVDDHGETALHIACKRGSLRCFSVLTQGSPHMLPSILLQANYRGHNCLHLTCIHGYLSLCESLVKLGADINAQEQCSGRSPLHLAVDLQNPQLVRLLISLGANVNSLTYSGHSPFHLTYGRHDTGIREQLYGLTDRSLRELPESESEDSDEDPGSEDEMYDDIMLVGQQ
ncbi:nuclear factor of kappa light polypeptide gene enhancer in B-cells inhibitor, alpha b [Paramormyrops kingsleyae]|uniref:nuclear factor of kappa light polypeptide gene enhancer in B-cells inhibitor, alpha b n=1 Tax=Paramormyrops kingsleyae TaxID=1676925 RepID=UPI003B972FB0